MSIEKLNVYKERIDKELEHFFNQKLIKAKDIDPSSVEMIELLKEYQLRDGKRIRAAMIYYGYRCFSNKDIGQILKASMAIELIQSYLLIHDDIIDQDDKRRNGPTMHCAYKKLAQKRYKKIDSDHFGISFAILAGDILCAFANEILTNLYIREKYKVNAIRRLNHVIHQVIYGEALDILTSYQEKLTKKDLEKVHYLKTATYTFEGPLHIGALLAGANKKQLESLSSYAIPLGKAFQIQDDILGMFGDEKKLGKPVGSDIKEGKRTLLIIKALESSTKKQKILIENVLGKKNITPKQLSMVRKIIKDTGSLEYSQDLAKKLVKQAKSAIIKSNFKKEGKQFLLEIADYMLERDY